MAGTCLALALFTLGAQGEAVIPTLTPERLEKFLAEQKLDFKKSSVKNEDVHYYTFLRGKFEVRLTSFGTQDLMLDCTFKPLPLDGINRWNVSAKFSRASWQKDPKGEPYSVLEYNLDCRGGVTPKALENYLARFDEELKNFDIYTSGPTPDPVIVTSVTDQKLEKVLKDLSVPFQKKELKGASVFEFDVGGEQVRLQSFEGKELRLAARGRTLGLADINQYNLSRKFIRAVNYKKDGMDITVLETCLDCEPGVNEGMLRHFVVSFADDVRHFAEYAQKKTASEKK
jgi:hypothetical protein